MTTNYAKHVSIKETPQTEAVPGKIMVANNAGGFSFAVDDWVRLDRWLIWGSSGGSFYATERKLTQENAAAVLRCMAINGQETVRRIRDVSVGGKAPKNDPAIFALALVAANGDEQTRHIAYLAMPEVCRTATHLFQFIGTCNELRGNGSGLHRAIKAWYVNKTPREVAYQACKYQQRDGWSHRDVMRMVRPKIDQGSDLQTIVHWMVKGWEGVGEEPHPREAILPIWAFERAKRATTAQEIVRLIRDYRLVRECIPTQWLNEAVVWDALLQEMPLTAMIRNLGKMTAVGLLRPLSQATALVCQRLHDEEWIKRARVHPLNLLVALKTYAQGHGDKGSLQWEVNQQIVTALDEGFYLAFGAIEPTGKRWLIGVDVSGSMSATCGGTPLSCCECATALGMVTVSVEPQSYVMAFNHGLQALPIGKGTRLTEALKYTRNINGGGTDCSLPMTVAAMSGLQVDTFLVLTDSETYAGRAHPCQALNAYRQKTGIGAKLIVAGLTSSGFTIADPADAGTLDVVGFSLDVPQVISQFAA